MDAIQRPGNETVDQALGWLEAERERPFFLWVHLYDAHTPYAAPREFASSFPRTLAGAYDAEIAYADAQLGRVLDALERDSRLERTVVAVLGDHGEMLGEHGELTHGFFVYDSAVRIPLVVAAPGLLPREVRDQVRIVDVMPTLLELLEVPVPKAVQGTSLLPLARGERLNLMAVSESWFPRFHYGWSELVAVQDERFKLIRAPRRELYDLERDPLEAKDLAASDPSRAETLERALDEQLARAGGGRPEGSAGGGSETSERLRALGYTGGSSGGTSRTGPRGDPKDKIGFYNLLKEASTASAEGRFEEAIEKADEGPRRRPRDPRGAHAARQLLQEGRAARDAIAATSGRWRSIRAPGVDLPPGARLQGRGASTRPHGFARASRSTPHGRALSQLADIDARAPSRRGRGDPEGRLGGSSSASASC